MSLNLLRWQPQQLKASVKKLTCLLMIGCLAISITILFLLKNIREKIQVQTIRNNYLLAQTNKIKILKIPEKTSNILKLIENKISRQQCILKAIAEIEKIMPLSTKLQRLQISGQKMIIMGQSLSLTSPSKFQKMMSQYFIFSKVKLIHIGTKNEIKKSEKILFTITAELKKIET